MGKTYLPNYEDGTSKRLYDPLSFITGLLQDFYKFPTISYKSPIKRLQDSYQDSYQEITVLLSRDYKTPIKTLITRLQHSYQKITALL